MTDDSRQPFICRKCGQIAWLGFLNWRDLIEAKMCFTCLDWSRFVLIRNRPDCVRVNHEHYMIENEDSAFGMRGHGGRRFEILFHDGRVVVTRNLWHQGNIPVHFREEIPDNATFAPYEPAEIG